MEKYPYIQFSVDTASSVALEAMEIAMRGADLPSTLPWPEGVTVEVRSFDCNGSVAMTIETPSRHPRNWNVPATTHVTETEGAVTWRPIGLDSEGNLWVRPVWATPLQEPFGWRDAGDWRKVEGLPREAFDTFLPARAWEVVGSVIEIFGDGRNDAGMTLMWGLKPEVEAFRRKLREVIME